VAALAEVLRMIAVHHVGLPEAEIEEILHLRAAVRPETQGTMNETVARKLVPMVIRIPAKAGSGGKLFGSVTAGDIVDAVASQTDIEIDRRRLRLDEPIKALGTHEVPVKLHADVEFQVTVDVVKA
jgi:large subunit ribosomal protein L9